MIASEKTRELEEKMRENLMDLSNLLERLAPLCDRTDDLIGVVRLALENTGQLRILMKTIMDNKK